MREEKLNPELNTLVEQKKLSTIKIKELLFLKKFIDRLSTAPFITNAKLKEIEEKFGTLPDIITWGDYFQTEVATENFDKTDDEFYTIIQTILYDIIISSMIFYEKDQPSIAKLKQLQWLALGGEFDESFKSPEELKYFNILLVYYEEMGLNLSLLQEEDFTFFLNFKLDAQAS